MVTLHFDMHSIVVPKSLQTRCTLSLWPVQGQSLSLLTRDPGSPIVY
jgi:hypothetical protein